jgi:RNA polymerase sigma-70 factor (family 1)
MMNEAPENVLALFNKGNKKAFATLYHLYFPSVLYFAKQLVINHQEAEDITTETFLKLWKLQGNFSTLEKIRAFLLTAAKNACLDHIRHANLKRAKKMEITHSLSRNDTTCDHDLLLSEFKRLIYMEIEKLPEKCRLTFKLSFLEGLKNEEIALHLNLSEKTVRNLKAEAVKRIRIFLKPASSGH